MSLARFSLTTQTDKRSRLGLCSTGSKVSHNKDQLHFIRADNSNFYNLKSYNGMFKEPQTEGKHLK